MTSDPSPEDLAWLRSQGFVQHPEDPKRWIGPVEYSGPMFDGLEQADDGPKPPPEAPRRAMRRRRRARRRR